MAASSSSSVIEAASAAPAFSASARLRSANDRERVYSQTARAVSSSSRRPRLSARMRAVSTSIISTSLASTSELRRMHEPRQQVWIVDDARGMHLGAQLLVVVAHVRCDDEALACHGAAQEARADTAPSLAHVDVVQHERLGLPAVDDEAEDGPRVLGEARDPHVRVLQEPGKNLG